ncbi:MAG TPA: methyltransferase domain-containing protein [Casimicrobiaceae bacterium]|jgi:SAM-dependent methyltransferase|nr:methyltransferase domain-containing protein [Casimicrobiaceae bacterium]
MDSKLTFTGERFLPGCTGEIAYEHWHRYAFARRFAAGRRVLDAACGEGYGTAFLGAVAESTVGVDIDIATIEHARATYGESAHLRFIAASCTGFPLPSASIDLVVSFETIEHLSAKEQQQMLSEFARVMRPEALLILSSPNKKLYSDARNFENQYHLQELDRDALTRLLARHFPAQRWLAQRLACWSALWKEGDRKAAETLRAEALLGNAAEVAPCATPEAMYFVVVAARSEAALPQLDTELSLFADADESALKRAEENAAEVLRLDRLLKERDSSIAKQAAHVLHLERLVAERERVVEERDRQVAELNRAREERERVIAERNRQIAEVNAARERMIAECDDELALRAQAIAMQQKKLGMLEAERARQEAALAAQERAIAYLQSVRGWLTWPSRQLRQRLGKR